LISFPAGFGVEPWLQKNVLEHSPVFQSTLETTHNSLIIPRVFSVQRISRVFVVFHFCGDLVKGWDRTGKTSFEAFSYAC